MNDRADTPDPPPETPGNAGDGPDSPLWRFALALYSVPAVSAACLSLQDSTGVDVNLLLVCCWTGRHGAYLPKEQIASLDRLVSPWRAEVIEPLRRLRRQLKTAVGPVLPERSATLREAVKKDELQAERIELDCLFQALDSLPAKNAAGADRGGVIRSNLLHYLAVLEIDLTAGPVRDGIETLVRETMALDGDAV